MPRTGDQDLVARAGRRLAFQTAALTGAAMLLLIGLVTLVVVRGQTSGSDRLLRQTAATADDVGDPPAGAWLLLVREGRVRSSPGLPPNLEPVLAQLRQSPASRGAPRTVHPDDRSFRVLTQSRDGRTVQVVLDLASQLRVRDQLLRAMGGAGLLSLLIASGLGIALGRRAVRPLAQALTLQRSFIADASHELRTPLTLLSTRVQVLDAELTRSGADQQVIGDARGVVRDVQRLGEVIEDLLVAADPRVDQVMGAVDLGQVVSDVVGSAAPHAAVEQVHLTVDVPPDVSLVVRGSESALRRAVLALLDNAVDHTPAGGSVALRLRRSAREVIVSVSDTGPGVPEDQAGELLGRRFHSGGQRAGRQHYGLGLALTHDVANRHGGQLRLTPSTAGATFELALPALDRAARTGRRQALPRKHQGRVGRLWIGAARWRRH